MIVDGIKDTAKGAFKASLFPLIGAAIVYVILKSWEGKSWLPWK
jgi:hypothetical protein